MFRNIIFLVCFFCVNFLFGNEHPLLGLRPKTGAEAFSYCEDLYKRLPWVKENGC